MRALSLILGLIMAVAFDVASPGASTTSAASVTSGSYTISSSATRYLFGFGGMTGTGPAGATNLKQGGSGGTSITALDAGLSVGTFSNLRIFGLKAQPSGAGTLYGDWAASKDEIAIGAVSYTGVDQTTPLRNSGTPTTATGTLSTTSTSCSVTVTGTQAGDKIVAAFYAEEGGFRGSAFTAGAGCTLRYAKQADVDSACCIVETDATGSSTTVTAVLTSPGGNLSGNWRGSGVALVPDGGGGGGGTVIVNSLSGRGGSAAEPLVH